MEGQMSDSLSDLRRLIDLDAAWESDPDETAFVAALGSLDQQMTDQQRLDHWLNGYFADHRASPGLAATRVIRGLGLVAMLAGILTGMGFMAMLVAYDGSQQVNILWILALTFVQTGLCGLTFYYLLRKKQRSWILSEVVAHVPLWLLRSRLRRIVQSPGQRSPFGQLHVPLLLLLTQRFAIAFSVAALVTLLGMVALQDIAFGWATTLALSPEHLHRLVSALAMPWQFLDAAVPSQALVENSQFFRMYNDPSVEPAFLGAWWPFLFCTWLMYALLPRVPLFFWTAFRWRRAQHDALLAHPCYQKTLQRLRFDHSGAARQSAKAIARMLGDMLSHVEQTSEDNARSRIGKLREELELRWQQWMLARENQTSQELARIYLQNASPLEGAERPVGNLFHIDDWERWGLSRRKLALVAAAGGAGAGAAIDAATGGVTLGLATAGLGMVAAGSAWFSSSLASVVAEGVTVRYGPASHANFPWVLLGRALAYWTAYSCRVPGQFRDSVAIPDWRELLDRRQQREIGKLFSGLQGVRRDEALRLLTQHIERLLFEMLAYSED